MSIKLLGEAWPVYVGRIEKVNPQVKGLVNDPF